MRQYLDLLQHVIDNGVRKDDRIQSASEHDTGLLQLAGREIEMLAQVLRRRLTMTLQIGQKAAVRVIEAHAGNPHDRAAT